jgi:hypothetical protein
MRKTDCGRRLEHSGVEAFCVRHIGAVPISEFPRHQAFLPWQAYEEKHQLAHDAPASDDPVGHQQRLRDRP